MKIIFLNENRNSCIYEKNLKKSCFMVIFETTDFFFKGIINFLNTRN